MDAKFEKVKQEITVVGKRIDDVEKKLAVSTDADEIAYLREKEEQLRDEKWLLREKELILLRADKQEVTPHTPNFRGWLTNNPAPEHGTDLEGILNYLKKVPCSVATIKFIKNHLCEVPDIANVHFDVVSSLGEKCFWREDIFSLLKSDQSKVLILSGKTRIGKSMAMAHEVVRARKEIYGVADKVLFYHPGARGLPDGRVNPIIKILSHMNIPSLWDEFTYLEVDLAKEYKILFESCLSLPRLCAVLFGSNEVVISDKGMASFSAVVTRGARVREFPWPSMELLLVMLLHRNPGLESFEIGSRFLRNFSVYGFNLASHMEEGDAHLESLEVLRDDGIYGATFLTGSRLETLERLAANKNKVDGISKFDLLRLENGKYIQKRNSGGHYDFRDPQLIAVANRNADLEDVEGRVLELLLRDFLRPQLFSLLTKQFPILEGLENQKIQVLHGNLTKNCEIDGLFFFRECGIIFSFKRSQSVQDWDKSFLCHLNHLSVEGKKQCANQHKDLALCRRLFLVSVSVVDGEIGGQIPSTYNHADLSLQGTYISEDKQIFGVTIFLHDLLVLLPTVKMTPSSFS